MVLDWDWGVAQKLWIDAGRSPASFWLATVREIQLVALSHAERVRRETDQIKWLAFHSEALARSKRLPDFNKFMGKASEAQSEEEMWNAWSSWVAIHNAKERLKNKLGDEFIEVELVDEGDQ